MCDNWLLREIIFKQPNTEGMSISERAARGVVYEKILARRKRGRKFMGQWENFLIPRIHREILAAEYACFTHQTYRDAKYVIQGGSPGLIRAMDGLGLSISTAAKLLRYSPQTQRRIFTSCDDQEIIDYARQFRQKIYPLPSAVIFMRTITAFWAWMVYTHRFNHQKKENTHG